MSLPVCFRRPSGVTSPAQRKLNPEVRIGICPLEDSPSAPRTGRYSEIWVFLQHGVGFHPDRFSGWKKCGSRTGRQGRLPGCATSCGLRPSPTSALFWSESCSSSRQPWRSRQPDTAGCNRFQEVEERLTRWLLMSARRMGSNSVPLSRSFWLRCWDRGARV